MDKVDLPTMDIKMTPRERTKLAKVLVNGPVSTVEGGCLYAIGIVGAEGGIFVFHFDANNGVQLEAGRDSEFEWLLMPPYGRECAIGARVAFDDLEDALTNLGVLEDE